MPSSLLSTPIIPTFISSLSSPPPTNPLPPPFRSSKTLIPSRRRRQTFLSPPLRVSAPPSPATTTIPIEDDERLSTKNSQGIQENEENQDSSSKFSWRDHWYPVSLVEDLDPSIATPFQLLNRDIVLWFERSGSQWVALDDKCPHRTTPPGSTEFFLILTTSTAPQAPPAPPSPATRTFFVATHHLRLYRVLPDSNYRYCSTSVWLYHRALIPIIVPTGAWEGRIDENGHLQCSYHGWSFDGCGSCVRIPQASAEGPEARALQSSRACATRFPTMVSQGLLFVWPDENGWERAQATSPPMLPDDFSNPQFSTVTIQRDLFYGYDTLMENVSDPSHIDFAHHKVTGRRDRAKALPFKMESSGLWGFSGSNDGNPKISAKFVAPCYYINKVEIDTKLPIVGDQKWIIWICSFNVPMTPGKTRSIVIPRWHEHWTSNKVYDGDMIVLQGQEKVFLSNSMEGGSADVNKEYTTITFTPTQADRFVLAFRNWLRHHWQQPARVVRHHQHTLIAVYCLIQTSAYRHMPRKTLDQPL
ncbi:hypothetical protein LguiB_031427 [Lonicera macranthoides]